MALSINVSQMNDSHDICKLHGASRFKHHINSLMIRDLIYYLMLELIRRSNVLYCDSSLMLKLWDLVRIHSVNKYKIKT